MSQAGANNLTINRQACPPHRGGVATVFFGRLMLRSYKDAYPAVPFFDEMPCRFASAGKLVDTDRIDTRTLNTH